MSETAESATWNDPEECPFCGAGLRNGGAGFVEHAEANADCMTRFDEWRENVAGDMNPEWTG